MAERGASSDGSEGSGRPSPTEVRFFVSSRTIEDGHTAVRAEVAPRKAGAVETPVVAVVGRDVVRLELVNGPELLLHPQTALELLSSQQGDGPPPREPGLAAHEARVPTRLQWRGSEQLARARGGAGGAGVGGQAVLHAFSVLKDVAAESLVTTAARKVDEQAPPGLFRLTPADPQGRGEPMGSPPGSTPDAPRLVLVHGTFSSTEGSFGRLWIDHPDRVRELFAAYPGGVYGFQHPTLLASPLDNALALARQLPAGGPVHFLTHSRGGLVVEALVQLANRPPTDADRSFFDAAPAGDSGGSRDEYARQKALLSEVAAAAGRLRIDRVVRVACPARGTLLASRRLDAYLSILKWGLQLAQVPVAPVLADLLLTFAKVGKSAEVLPGLEAMTPDCPFLRWLCSSVEAVPSDLRVVAGDLQGDSIGSWVKTLLADAFYWTDNDLVVQTRSMYGGCPRSGGSAFFLDRGGKVTHFAYFSNPATSAAITRALLDRRIPDGFAPIGPQSSQGFSSAGDRGGGARDLVADSRSPERPAVIVLPGILGTNLSVAGHRIWLGVRILNGLPQLAYHAGDATVQTDGLLGLYYDELVAHLAETHEVIPFPFDWRLPIDAEARRLAAVARRALDDRRDTRKPVRMIAHSMGGLVARALELEAPDVWRDLMDHEDARLLMLGTPNGGSWAPMQALSGDDRLSNLLGAVGTLFDLGEARDLFAHLPGFLQLQAGLLDETKGLTRSKTWSDLAQADRQLWEIELAWFQLELQRKVAAWGIPSDQVLARARELQARLAAQDLGAAKRHILMVLGSASRTPCGYELDAAGRFEYLQTDQGDGAVPDASAVMTGVATWRAAVEHGDLPRHRELFPGFVELLVRGATISQELKPVGTRGAVRAADAGRVESMPRTVRARGWTAEALDSVAGIDAAIGAPPEEKAGLPAPSANQVTPIIGVSVMNGDLTFVKEPLLLGHYRSLMLTGAERVIDRFIGGTMSQALRLRRYPTATGESEVFVNRQPNPDDRADVPRPSAVIVVGLGPEGELRAEELSRSVRQGVIGYAQGLAQDPKGPSSFALAATLAGSGGLGISVGMSARAIIQGVRAANERLLKEGWPIVARLRFVELYEDRATEVLRELLAAAERLPAVFSVNAALEVGQRPLPRPDTPGYRGAEYDYVSAVSGATEEGHASIAFTVDTRRARTEVRSTSAQLGLVQGLIAEAEADRRADAKLGKTLFRVLVPAELDAFFGDSSAVVLEVDDATAAIPWEVLGVDHEDDQPNELPWSIRTRLIRKLRSLSFRENPNPAGSGAGVLVFGDPDCDRDRFPRLAGARREAQMVAGVLGLDKPIIEATARVMVSALLDRPYSVIHIAGHGREDGAGVVMSGGQVLGADLVERMRRVPDLVFVNCCHSGRQVLGGGAERDVPGRPARAATIASGLIRLGVRCVIATGWAVDDDAAERFAQVFYQGLKGGRTFIQATSQARETIWREFRDSNTWAAYQCYGDPDWAMPRADGGADEARPAAPAVAGRQRPRPESRSDSSPESRPESRIVSPKTLQAALKSAVPRGGADDPTSPDAARVLDDLARAFGPTMGSTGEVAEAFAQAYADVGRTDEAVSWYERAIAAEKGGASLRSLEQLCNLTARRAAERVEDALRAASAAAGGGGAPVWTAFDAEVERARGELDGAEERLRSLVTLNRTYERLSLLASVAKRRALIEQAVRRAHPTAAGPSGEASKVSTAGWRKAVAATRDAYAVAEAHARKTGRGDVYYASLNRMTAELLLRNGHRRRSPARAGEVEAVRRNLMDRAEQEPDFWTLVQLFELDVYVALSAGALAAARPRIEDGLRKLYGRIDARLKWASVRDQARFVLVPYAAATSNDEERAAADAVLGLLEGFASGTSERARSSGAAAAPGPGGAS